MVTTEEEEATNFESRGDYGLLVSHEWGRPQGQRYCGLDSVPQVKPILLANLLLAF
jgi:hypothetical protein